MGNDEGRNSGKNEVKSRGEEVGFLELGLELLLEPVVRRDVGLVGSVRWTSAACDGPNKTTTPVDSHGPRVTFVREPIVLARFSVVAKDDDLDRVDREAVIGVMTGDGLEAIYTAKGGTGGASVLDRQEGLHVVDVVVLGITEFLFADVVLELEEKVVGGVEVATVVRLREHVVLPVDSRLVSACRQRGVSEKYEREKRKTDAPTKSWLPWKFPASNLSLSS